MDEAHREGAGALDGAGDAVVEGERALGETEPAEVVAVVKVTLREGGTHLTVPRLGDGGQPEPRRQQDPDDEGRENRGDLPAALPHSVRRPVIRRPSRLGPVSVEGGPSIEQGER